MHTTVSIGRHIRSRVALLVAAFIIIYSVTINVVYNWGIFDSTHYFLSLEADRVIDELERTGRLPPETSKDTHYFKNRAQLSEKLSRLFPYKKHQDGKLLSYETDGDVIYLLPYRCPKTGQFFYVSHTYKASEDVYEPGLTISQLQFLLALCVLIIVIVLARNMAWSITKPVRALEKLTSAIRPEAEERATLRSQLKFTELVSVADRLAESVAIIESRNQREKSFLRTLSHELRTPLAITKAALNLLEKNADGLGASHLRKLELVQRANDNMLSTTECLLWLWGGKDRPLAREDVSVCAIVSDIISNNAYLLQRKSVDVTLDIHQDLVYCIERNLFEMTIGNLVRNAFQYTDMGTVEILADSRQITVNNPISGQFDDHETPAPISSSIEDDYGYGIGLYLVENICAQQGWLLEIGRREQVFSVRIALSPAAV